MKLLVCILSNDQFGLKVVLGEIGSHWNDYSVYVYGAVTAKLAVQEALAGDFLGILDDQGFISMNPSGNQLVACG